MPFKSHAQMKAAFGGHLGPAMKAKAPEWTTETTNKKTLPTHVQSRRKAILTRLKGR